MSLTVVTGPTLEPVSLAEAKAHLRVEVPDEDALIDGYILAAREYIERETQRALITQTLDYKTSFSRWYSQCGNWPIYYTGECYRTGIMLPRPPLQSVTSLAYVDSAGATQTLAANQYQVILDNGDSHEGLIVPAFGVTWPTLQAVPDALTIRFVAGYGGMEDVPHSIRQAMLLLIGQFYEQRENVIAGASIAEVPFAVASLISHFRIY